PRRTRAVHFFHGHRPQRALHSFPTRRSSDLRIDDCADVVDHRVADDVHGTGLAVDLDLADVAAVGEVLHLCGIDGGGDQPHLHAGGQLDGSDAACATSLMVMVRLLFGLENSPSANVMSASPTCNRWAAILIALAIIFS